MSEITWTDLTEAERLILDIAAIDLVALGEAPTIVQQMEPEASREQMIPPAREALKSLLERGLIYPAMGPYVDLSQPGEMPLAILDEASTWATSGRGPYWGVIANAEGVRVYESQWTREPPG